MTDISAPLFVFEGIRELSAKDLDLHNGFSSVSFALTGPGATAEAGHLAVRGDLAHINLAGRYFVPHYAAPMPRLVAAGGSALRRNASEDAEAIETLPPHTLFNVLDMAGGWAWGQVGEAGYVGYLPLSALEDSQA